MSNSLYRYYKRKEMRFICEVVTPMFLGNARQEAELRTAPFKSLLRSWWRVTQHRCPDFSSLLQKESLLFGTAGESENEKSGKSLIHLMVTGKADPSRDNFKFDLNIKHPETKQGIIGSLQYLAGIGLIRNGVINHSYLKSGNGFDWNINFPAEVEKDLLQALALIRAFGAIGSRSRNGWGSFRISDLPLPKEEIINLLWKCTYEWKEGFTRDYPNCLGQDEKGPLLWKTKATPSWAEAMQKLAETYVKIRAEKVQELDKLNPGDNNTPGERHLLGVPLTHHNPERWGRSARHASPLRFVIRKNSQEKFVGFVLHLPHKHSEKMPFPKNIDQIAVWEKIHQKLDYLHLLTRANYEECL